MITCKQAEEWIERFIDGEAALPAEVESHISFCAHCRNYQANLETIARTLNFMKVPEPPPELTDDVMHFIHEREIERHAAPLYFIPGLAPLQNAWQTLLEYLSVFRIPLPMILRREALPTALASLAVVWGVMIGPNGEIGKTEAFLNSPLAKEALKITDTIREKGENLAQQISSFASELIEDVTQTSQTPETENIIYPYIESQQTFLHTVKRA